ncbi:hypothetical protein [Streptomyces sp. DH-12]|nr:hypothetical protein [Streptomyces sp. DH-12]
MAGASFASDRYRLGLPAGSTPMVRGDASGRAVIVADGWRGEPGG